MTSAAPTMLALETDSMWLVVIAVSIVTFPAVLILGRLIRRPGGLASGIALTLPLALPVLAAVAFRPGVLPEITVLRPAVPAFLQSPKQLLHLLLLSDETAHTVTPYAFSGSTGAWLLFVGASLSSFMLLRRALGGMVVRRLLRRARPLERSAAAHLSATVERLSLAAGLRRAPCVVVSPAVGAVAFATSRGRGWIVLAEELLSELDDDELGAVLAHEIAHLAARDVEVVTAAGVLRDMVAWNPIAHFAYRRLLRERELEADRRAATLTGRPLAVASSLLKMCELTKVSRRGRSPALAFLYRRASVSQRVSRLIALADGGTAAMPPCWAPYVLATCLVAALGLQVGARVAHQDGAALALMWGTPPSSEARIWQPPGTEWEPKKQRSRSVTGSHDAPPRTALGFNRAGVRSGYLLQVAERTVALKRRDFPEWLHYVSALAERRGLSAAALRREASRNWHAVPLFPTAEDVPFGIYRVEQLP
jgi:Zn-dependent protease with chaperone function